MKKNCCSSSRVNRSEANFSSQVFFNSISLKRISKIYLSPCPRSVRNTAQYDCEKWVGLHYVWNPVPPLPKKKYPRNINSIVQHCQRHSSLPHPSNLPLLFSSVCKDSARTRKKKNWYFRLASLVINLRLERGGGGYVSIRGGCVFRGERKINRCTGIRGREEEPL